MIELPERLIAHRLISESGCWEWTRCRTDFGYGRISWNNHVRTLHRLAAHLVFGLDFNDERRVLHRCDNPPCFNPEHLFVGTQADNVADMVSKGRWRGGGKPQDVCKKGHPLVGDNIIRNSGGWKTCRICKNNNQRAYYQRRKDAEGAFWQESRRARAAVLDGMPEP